jgi:hypothetical protein
MRHRPHVSFIARSGFLLIGLVVLSSSRAAKAQTVMSSQATHHATVCAAGVRTYASLGEVPTPHDMLTLPPAEPVRVTNEAEAAAADSAVHARAGSIGATGVVITEVTAATDGGTVVRRQVVPVFVPGDSARAHGACQG